MKAWPIIAITAALAGISAYMTIPRGARNNNPGNIRATPGVTWKGQVGQDEKGFVVFAKVEYGFRAMAIVLKTYREKHALDTIESIISRWAPPSENDTAAYIASVAKQIKWPPDAVLPQMKTPELMAAIARHETGMTWDKMAILDGWAAA